jgi:TPR repeat protein
MNTRRDEEKQSRARRRAIELMAGSGDALLSRFEMAALLGVTTRTVDRWEREQRMPRRRQVGKRAVGWRVAAAKWLKTACDGGSVLVACANLGILYATGTGVVKDLVRAALLYGFACDCGDLIGCHLQGAAYDRGLGVVQDKARAERLYDRACKGRDFPACVRQGTLLATGDGVPVNREEAIGLFLRACHAG